MHEGMKVVLEVRDSSLEVAVEGPEHEKDDGGEENAFIRSSPPPPATVSAAAFPGLGRFVSRCRPDFGAVEW